MIVWPQFPLKRYSHEFKGNYFEKGLILEGCVV